MKFFQTAQTHFAILGIDSKQIMFLQNSRLLLGFVISGLNIILCSMYIFCVATTFEECIECISTTLGSVGGSMCFGIIVFHTPDRSDIIDRIEEMIAISE